MLSGMAMSMMALVVWISACGGVGSPEGWLRINILEGRISFRSKLLAISYVRKGYVIGVSSSLQIVIDPKCHAVAFTKLHDHIVARIPNRYLSRSDHLALR